MLSSSPGGRHSFTSKIQDKAKKLIERIKQAREQECEVLETIVTTEKICKVDLDHAREIIDTFLKFGQVTATTEPDEGYQLVILQTFPAICSDNCVLKTQEPNEQKQVCWETVECNEEECFVSEASHPENCNETAGI